MVNQKDILAASEIFNSVRPGAVSMVEQVPCTNDEVALFAYHVGREGEPIKKAPIDTLPGQRYSGICLTGNHYTMLWTAETSAPEVCGPKNQTQQLFSSWQAAIGRRNLNLRNNLVRTWMYVRDIDNNYHGMVEGRAKLFAQEGLVRATRFIASTGIEGKGPVTAALVTMDALLFGNIKEEQLRVINAPENLSPAISYGVTFERGLRVMFGDRSHLYISGTASIDPAGTILHSGNVEKQTMRTIDNIEALLKSQGGALGDMAYAIAYVRNPKHFVCVNEILKKRLPPDLPLVFVQGAVCRPGWLFEMECMAIIPDKQEYPPFL
jgi:enamine deaminase RidA (YjgF/YER057c/UK114 family)